MGAKEIKALRELSGAGILDCKKALAASGGDVDGAMDWLRKKGQAKAVKKATRAATEGLVYSYIHGSGRIGVLIEVNCETDFCARGDRFGALVKDLAMHIAASAPDYVSRDEISEADATKEREIQLARVIEEGKPSHIAERIVEGRMNKWYEEVCLLDQKFVKDDKITIKALVTDAIADLGENIKVRRFTRYFLGEGLKKKADDFAAEVAAAAGQG